MTNTKLETRIVRSLAKCVKLIGEYPKASKVREKFIHLIIESLEGTVEGNLLSLNSIS